MNQEPRRYTRADYRRAVRRRRIKARVGIVSAAAAVLLLVIGAGVLIVNRLLPGITVNTAGKPESAQTSAVQEPGGKSSGACVAARLPSFSFDSVPHTPLHTSTSRHLSFLMSGMRPRRMPLKWCSKNSATQVSEANS